MIKTPTIVPHSLPFPPDKLVPPITTAAIASSSYETPACGKPADTRDDKIIAAKPDNKPHIVYTKIFTFFTLIPDTKAACSLPPIA